MKQNYFRKGIISNHLSMKVLNFSFAS